MSRVIDIHYSPGASVYVHLRNEEGLTWDGSAAVAFQDADWSDYAVNLTEDGSSGYYQADFPSGLPSGEWSWIAYEKLGASPATTDAPAIGSGHGSPDSELSTVDLSTSAAAAVCNLALSHLGVGKTISNLETDDTQESRACLLFYDIVRDKIIRGDFAWPFCTKISTLGLVEEDPNDEWSFAYRYPTDCLMVRRFLSGVRTDTRDTRAPYKIARDSSGLLVYSDLEDAQIEYTMRETDNTHYPPDFTMAFSFLLAAYIAPRLTNGDPFKMGERAMAMYDREISRAAAAAGNEEQPDVTPESEFIRARD